MNLDLDTINQLTDLLEKAGYLPGNAKQYLQEIAADGFIFRDQLLAADSIHLHIKVADVNELPHTYFLRKGGKPQNAKDGYIKYVFPGSVNFIFSSIPISQEEKMDLVRLSFPYLDHIGINIRQENDNAYHVYNQIPLLAASQNWAFKKQGGKGKKVYCCHVQVNEKYWVYPPGSVYLEFAFGQLIISQTSFGCDLRPANPSLCLPEQDTQGCCGNNNIVSLADFSTNK